MVKKVKTEKEELENENVVIDAEVEVPAQEDVEETVEDDSASDDEINSILSAAKVQQNVFDWDKYEAEKDGYSKSEKDALQNKYEQTLSTNTENEVTEGTVVTISKREVVVNIGYKSDGVVSFNEFRYNPDLKVGDKVEVYVESLEDKSGQLLLSHKKARAMKSWDRVNQALENGEVVKGFVKCRTKGGMIVEVFGIEAFLPGSQIDVKPIRDYDVFVGKTMEFKVVKINQEFKNESGRAN